MNQNTKIERHQYSQSSNKSTELQTPNENGQMLRILECQLNDKDVRPIFFDFLQNHNVADYARVEKLKAPESAPASRIEVNQNVQQLQKISLPPFRTHLSKNSPQRVDPSSQTVTANMAAGALPLPFLIAPAFLQISSSSMPPKNSLPSEDDKSAFTDSVGRGMVLKKDYLTTLSDTGDMRSALMKEIQHGIALRPATDRKLPCFIPHSDRTVGRTDSLADALRRALNARLEARHSSSDTNSDNDNDEWED